MARAAFRSYWQLDRSVTRAVGGVDSACRLSDSYGARAAYRVQAV